MPSKKKPIRKTNPRKKKPVKKKKPVNKSKVRKKKPVKKGRPNKKLPKKADVKKQAAKGKTDVELAKHFGVSKRTLERWKKDFPVFWHSLKVGKNMSDDKVEAGLYQRAMGYSHPEEKIFQNNGRIVRTQTIKHYPPNLTAQIFWLKNRQPKKWRDLFNSIEEKIEKVELNKKEIKKLRGEMIKEDDV